jgi:hypothetical protein
MPQLFPGAAIEFRAGLELVVLHNSLALLAWLRSKRIIPNLASADHLLHHTATLFELFGSDSGGMFVELTGRAEDGAAKLARWTLIAIGGDGPFIPALGAASLVRRLADGDLPECGARVCAGDITLADFEREFAPFNITTRTEYFDGENAISESVGRGLRPAT